MKHVLKKIAACLVLFGTALGAARANTTLQLVSSSYSWQIAGAQSGIVSTSLSQTGSQVSSTVTFSASPLTYSGGGLEEYVPISNANWNAYHTLTLKYTLTSTNSTITSDGLPVTLSIYDGSAYHEIAGTSGDPGQNKRLLLNANGSAQTLVLDLRAMHRASVNGFTIWLGSPYNTTYGYTLKITSAQLTSYSPLWDGKGTGTLTAPSNKTVADTVSTSDNLNLQLTSQGALVGITKGTGTPVAWGNNAKPGGLMVRDNTASTPTPTQLLGTVSSVTGGYSVAASNSGLTLNTTTSYTASGNMIHVALSATNTSSTATRYLTFYLALPVKTSSTTWKWSTDLLTNVTVGSTATTEELTYRYPIQTLCGTSGANTVGLSMAVPLNEPQNFRLAYNEANGVLYAAWDIALTNISKSGGGSFNTATTDLYLYSCDPAWGIRSALQTYYTNFSSWFTQRFPGGGWSVWDRGGDPSLLYDWGGNPIYYNQTHVNGGYEFVYIFPNYLDVGVNDLATPSRAAITTRLSNLAAANPTELAAVEALPYSPDVYSGINSDALWTGAGQASAASSYYDVNGNLVTGLGYQGSSEGFVATLPANLVAAIPNGAGTFQITFAQVVGNYLIAQAGGGQWYDGWSIDGTWPDYSHDYHSADFPYMPFPLSFERDINTVSVPTRLAFASWMGSLNAADTTKGLFINATANAAQPVTFMTPYVDVFGNEESYVDDPAYNRQLAAQRVVTYLPYTAQPDAQVYYHLLYNIYPGSGLSAYQYQALDAIQPLLEAAQWQPVTYATSSNSLVRVERYGTSSPYYLVCYNTSTSSQSFNLTVNTAGMGFTPNRMTSIFGPDQIATLNSSGVFPLALGGGVVTVLKVENNSTVWSTVMIGTGGDNDVIVPTGSQTLMAAQAYSSSLSNGVTLNGVAFTAVNLGSGTTFSSGNVSGTAHVGASNASSVATYPYSSPPLSQTNYLALSANYQSLIEGGLVGAGSSPDGSGNYTLGTDTITLSGLTSGKTYIARFWANCNSGGGSVNVTMAFGPLGSTTIATGKQGDGSINLLGTMFTAVFTATGTTQTFVYETNYQPQINALEVIQQN